LIDFSLEDVFISVVEQAQQRGHRWITSEERNCHGTTNAFLPRPSKTAQLGRDRLTLALALGLPLILLLLFGFAVSLDVNKINFAIQDLDRAYKSRGMYL